MILKTALLFFGGLFGGLYGASVGGGGLFTLPLLLLAGLPTQVALGSQRLAGVMLEGTGSIRFYRAKKIDLKLALLLGLCSAVGAIISVKILVHLPQHVLNPIVGSFLIIATVVLLNRDRINLEKYHFNQHNLALLVPTSLLLGFYGGFLGAGFGAFSVIALSLFGFSFLESAANARVMGFCTSLAGTVIFAEDGLIDYRLALALGAGFAIGSWIGVGLALKRTERYMRSLLLIVITASLIKLLWSL